MNAVTDAQSARELFPDAWLEGFSDDMEARALAYIREYCQNLPPRDVSHFDDSAEQVFAKHTRELLRMHAPPEWIALWFRTTSNHCYGDSKEVKAQVYFIETIVDKVAREESLIPSGKFSGLNTSLAADIEPQPIKWLWPNRFAIGKLSIIAGFPDAGKSQIAINIAATVSNGGKWPNAEGTAQRGATLFLSSEDDAADTIVPRLKAAGADLSQISVVSSIVQADDKARVFSLGDDLERLSIKIEQERAAGRNIRLVIIDPISAYMGGSKKGDTFKNSDVRSMLTPLTEWAAKHDVAVIAISHFNKAGNSNALYKVTDSIAFTAAARSVWLTATDESDQKMMLKGKNNIGPDPGGLEYSIEGVDIDANINAPRIVWGGAVIVTADEVLNARKDRGSSALDEAMLWLENYLSDGPKPQKEIMSAAQSAGHSTVTIQRAKKTIGARSQKGDFGDGWQWYMPEHQDDQQATGF